MPRGVVFLCVANSARSQMAEGLARSMLAESTVVSSAGSAPTQVHPLAIEVMGEIGIDIGAQRSKSAAEIAPEGVALVVTLCSGEACPAALGSHPRYHLPCPDPAAVSGSLEDQRAAFRQVRDYLREQLPVILGRAGLELLEAPERP